MRLRTIVLLLLALAVAGGTAMLARSWLAAKRSAVEAEAAPLAAPPPVKSVLIARVAIDRGRILKPEDFAWQPWPEGGIDHNYVVEGSRPADSFAGWVARLPLAAGEPITEAKITGPGNRGFLAAVLRPGMRAVAVPVTLTTDISGFIFPGDSVDLMITYSMPSVTANGTQYEHKASETVLHDVRVIAIDQQLETKAGQPVLAHTATLEVTPKQSEVIALASELGKLSLTLRSIAPVAANGAPGGPTPDSEVVPETSGFTLDSDISPIVPQPGGTGTGTDGAVTILRGSGK